jgi:hypothetical protein
MNVWRKALAVIVIWSTLCIVPLWYCLILLVGCGLAMVILNPPEEEAQ